MLAPIPSTQLESQIRTQRNLEGSVRSRGGGRGAGRDRDLIEAGLSEPAGWRTWLWGLWLWPEARARAPAEGWADVGRLIAIGEDDYGWQKCAGEAVPTQIAGIAAWRGTGIGSASSMTPAGVIGARCRKSGAVGSPTHHEVSSQKDGRRGSDGGSLPRVIIVPPQHGQRSSGSGQTT